MNETGFQLGDPSASSFYFIVFFSLPFTAFLNFACAERELVWTPFLERLQSLSPPRLFISLQIGNRFTPVLSLSLYIFRLSRMGQRGARRKHPNTRTKRQLAASHLTRFLPSNVPSR